MTPTTDRDQTATLDEAWAVDDAPPVGPEPDGEERAWWWGVQRDALAVADAVLGTTNGAGE